MQQERWRNSRQEELEEQACPTIGIGFCEVHDSREYVETTKEVRLYLPSTEEEQTDKPDVVLQWTVVYCYGGRRQKITYTTHCRPVWVLWTG